MVREQRQHLLLRLDVLLLGVAQAVRVVNIRVGSKADEAVVHGAVLLAHKMGVVGGDDLYAVFFRQLEDFLRVVALVLVQLVVQPRDLRLVLHHLQVVVFPEHALVPQDGLFYGFVVMGHDGAGNLPGQAGAGADEALVVLFNHLMAHARPVILAVDVPLRDNLYQVQVTGVVFGQEDKVIIAFFLEPMVPFGHVDFAADDGLHVGVLLGKLEELLDAEHVAVVRDGKGRHPQLVCPVKKVLYGRLSVQDGVLGMDMQMHKTHKDKGNDFPLSAQIKL